MYENHYYNKKITSILQNTIRHPIPTVTNKANTIVTSDRLFSTIKGEKLHVPPEKLFKAKVSGPLKGTGPKFILKGGEGVKTKIEILATSHRPWLVIMGLKKCYRRSAFQCYYLIFKMNVTCIKNIYTALL